jgi:hypothetical protein
VGIKLSWDELIPTELNQKFLKICSNLHLIDQFEIPRSVIQSENIKTIELHGFCDASKSAYGAAIYIRSIDENNEVTVQLLCSKSRVAPLKPLTIPWCPILESMELILIGKIGKFSHEKCKSVFWTYVRWIVPLVIRRIISLSVYHGKIIFSREIRLSNVTLLLIQ